MKRYISSLIEQAVRDISPEDAEQVLSSSVLDVSSTRPEFGDYSTNVAMTMFKKFNIAPAKNPIEFAGIVAERIAKLDKQNTFNSVVVAGGFINLTLKQSVLAGNITNFIQDVVVEQSGKGLKVVFEYSSPNTNKALHIGHVRNDLYGKACINLLKATGHEVVTCEIINDRGIHIMKSILMYQKYGEGQTPETTQLKPDHFVGKYYAMFGQKASESEEQEKQLLEEAQGLLQKWEDGDADVRNIWQQMNTWFYVGAKETYDKEGTTFDEVNFESEIYDKGRELVLSGVEKNLFTKEPDGSVSVDLEAQKLGKKYLLRKDGTTLYITQDMYLWDLRNQKHQPDMALVTTASEQAYHFAVLSEIFKLLQYDWGHNFKHLPYEHVYLGKDKMSSRSGNTVTADELLITVKEKVKSIMKEAEYSNASSDDEHLVEQIAFGAIKYGYLQYEPNTRIYFDIDTTIALQGNTGPYIQYTYARIQSILTKLGSYQITTPTELSGKEELSLMRKLIHYEEAVLLATKTYKPNILCTYLHELASELNTFYGAISVTKELDLSIQAQRATVLSATAKVIKHGLNLLGIASPEKM